MSSGYVVLQRSTFSILLLAALASGCVLIVPSADPGGPHCQFAGIETTCGKCLAAQCIQYVDACCSDDACGGIIKDVEGCASRRDASCDRLESLAASEQSHRDLSTCAATHCKDVCAVGAAQNLTRCGPAYATSVDACSCELSETPNDTTCAAVNHPRLRCCAPQGWPGPALACDCLSIICVPTSDLCQCQLTGIDDRGRAAECNGAFCCADPRTSTCICRSTRCLPQENAVPSCTIDQIECSTGRHRVESCAAPK